MVLVYISHIDTYAGGNVGQTLSQSKVGATSEGIHEDKNADDDGGQQQPNNSSPTATPCYDVVGTLADPSSPKPCWTKAILQPQSREDLLSVLLTCDVVMYDIREDQSQVEEASWAVQALHDQMSTFTSQKVFVCVSTILTWARTKTLIATESSIPYTEEDYRRRQSHPNFKDHVAAEKLIIRLGKTDSSKLQTYVLACGLLYGQGEDILHFLFKTAWLGTEPHLKMYGNGQNIIPTIHIQDLASVVVNVLDRKPDTRYLMAVDDSHNTLEEITVAISRKLGTGKVHRVPKEEALVIRDLSQSRFDQLFTNLLVEPVFIKDSMRIEWIAEAGFVDNIDNVIKEFRSVRKLMPIKICVLGPPMSGKTTVARKLCHHYKLHHISAANVAQSVIKSIEQLDDGNHEEDSKDGDRKAQEAKSHTDVLTDDFEEIKERPRYIDQDVVQLVKDKLKSIPCQNQGFILDGYPESLQQANDLFARDEDSQEEEADEEEYNKLIMPELVVNLQASYTFLRNRMQNFPQCLTAVPPQYRDEDKELLERMKVYASTSSLECFEKLGIRLERVSTEEDKSLEMQATVDTIIQLIETHCRKRVFTVEEKVKMGQHAQQQQEFPEEPDRLEQERWKAMEKKFKAKTEEMMQQRLVLAQQGEQEMLEVQSTPLRNYLMRHVMPTLTQGLIQVCRVRPEDPIDYLAEYLFKQNPQRSH